MSYRSDQYAIAINTFSFDWANLKFYAFPPFSVISSVLPKMEMDQAEGICILPNWPTQAWYAKVTHLMKQKPVILKPGKTFFICPATPRKLSHCTKSYSYWSATYRAKTRKFKSLQFCTKYYNIPMEIGYNKTI